MKFPLKIHDCSLKFMACMINFRITTLHKINTTRLQAIINGQKYDLYVFRMDNGNQNMMSGLRKQILGILFSCNTRSGFLD